MNPAAFAAPAATSIFMRSLAVNLPLVGLVATAAIGGWHLFRHLGKPDEQAERRAKFLRVILAAPEISDHSAAYWLDLPDPIAVARDTIGKIGENDPTTKALRAALAAAC